jgi:hypothetical protein
MIPSSCCPLYQQHETPANPAGDRDGPHRSYTTPRDTIEFAGANPAISVSDPLIAVADFAGGFG